MPAKRKGFCLGVFGQKNYNFLSHQSPNVPQQHHKTSWGFHSSCSCIEWWSGDRYTSAVGIEKGVGNLENRGRFLNPQKEAMKEPRKVLILELKHQTKSKKGRHRAKPWLTKSLTCLLLIQTVTLSFRHVCSCFSQCRHICYCLFVSLMPLQQGGAIAFILQRGPCQNRHRQSLVTGDT